MKRYFLLSTLTAVCALPAKVWAPVCIGQLPDCQGYVVIGTAVLDCFVTTNPLKCCQKTIHTVKCPDGSYSQLVTIQWYDERQCNQVETNKICQDVP